MAIQKHNAYYQSESGLYFYDEYGVPSGIEISQKSNSWKEWSEDNNSSGVVDSIYIGRDNSAELPGINIGADNKIISGDESIGASINIGKNLINRYGVLIGQRIESNNYGFGIGSDISGINAGDYFIGESISSTNNGLSNFIVGKNISGNLGYGAVLLGKNITADNSTDGITIGDDIKVENTNGSMIIAHGASTDNNEPWPVLTAQYDSLILGGYAQTPNSNEYLSSVPAGISTYVNGMVIGQGRNMSAEYNSTIVGQNSLARYGSYVLGTNSKAEGASISLNPNHIDYSKTYVKLTNISEHYKPYLNDIRICKDNNDRYFSTTILSGENLNGSITDSEHMWHVSGNYARVLFNLNVDNSTVVTGTWSQDGKTFTENAGGSSTAIKITNHGNYNSYVLEYDNGVVTLHQDGEKGYEMPIYWSNRKDVYGNTLSSNGWVTDGQYVYLNLKSNSAANNPNKTEHYDIIPNVFKNPSVNYCFSGVDKFTENNIIRVPNDITWYYTDNTQTSSKHPLIYQITETTTNTLSSVDLTALMTDPIELTTINTANYGSVAIGSHNYAYGGSIAINSLAAERNGLNSYGNSAYTAKHHIYYDNGYVVTSYPNTGINGLPLTGYVSARSGTIKIDDRVNVAEGAAVAIGVGNYRKNVANYGSLVIGKNASAYYDAFAIGSGVYSMAGAMVIGEESTAKSRAWTYGAGQYAEYNAMAIGIKGNNVAYRRAMAVGSNNTAYENSYIFGEGNSGIRFAYGIGSNNRVGKLGFALGYDTSSFDHSIGIGGKNSADAHSILLGHENTGKYSTIAIGYNNFASNNAILLGSANFDSLANGVDTPADNDILIGINNIIVGRNTISSDENTNINYMLKSFGERNKLIIDKTNTASYNFAGIMLGDGNECCISGNDEFISGPGGYNIYLGSYNKGSHEAINIGTNNFTMGHSIGLGWENIGIKGSTVHSILIGYQNSAAPVKRELEDKIIKTVDVIHYPEEEIEAAEDKIETDGTALTSVIDDIKTGLTTRNVSYNIANEFLNYIIEPSYIDTPQLYWESYYSASYYNSQYYLNDWYSDTKYVSLWTDVSTALLDYINSTSSEQTNYNTYYNSKYITVTDPINNSTYTLYTKPENDTNIRIDCWVDSENPSYPGNWLMFNGSRKFYLVNNTNTRNNSATLISDLRNMGLTLGSGWISEEDYAQFKTTYIENYKNAPNLFYNSNLPSNSSDLLLWRKLYYAGKNVSTEYKKIIQNNIVNYSATTSSFETQSFVAGTNNIANHHNSILIGTNNISLPAMEDIEHDDGFTVAIGLNNIAARNYDMAIGYATLASGGENIAIGAPQEDPYYGLLWNTNAVGYRNIAIRSNVSGIGNIAFESNFEGKGINNVILNSQISGTTEGDSNYPYARNDIRYSNGILNVSNNFTDNVIKTTTANIDSKGYCVNNTIQNSYINVTANEVMVNNFINTTTATGITDTFRHNVIFFSDIDVTSGDYNFTYSDNNQNHSNFLVGVSARNVIGTFGFADKTWNSLQEVVRSYSFGDNHLNRVRESTVFGQSNSLSSTDKSFVVGNGNSIHVPCSGSSDAPASMELIIGFDNIMNYSTITSTNDRNKIIGNGNNIYAETDVTDNVFIGNGNRLIYFTNVPDNHDRFPDIPSYDDIHDTYALYRNVVLGSNNAISQCISNGFIAGDYNTIMTTNTGYEKDDSLYDSSIILGFGNVAYNGSKQLAIGEHNNVSGHFAYALGEDLSAQDFQMVVGKYNAPVPKSTRTTSAWVNNTVVELENSGVVFAIGNGRLNCYEKDGDFYDGIDDEWGPIPNPYDESLITRSNAMIVSANGTVSAGDFEISGCKLSDIIDVVTLLKNKPASGQPYIMGLDNSGNLTWMNV